MKRQLLYLTRCSYYTDRIAQALEQKHVGASKDIASICTLYLDLPKRSMYKIKLTVEGKKIDTIYEMVVLAYNRYELLDIFFTYFEIDFEELADQFFNVVDSINLVMPDLFASEEPVLLSGRQYTKSKTNQITLNYTNFWKHFRDGYRRGKDLSFQCFSKIPSSLLKKYNPHLFYLELQTGVLLQSGWYTVSPRETSLMYKHKIWNFMDLQLGITFSDQEESDCDYDYD